MLRIEDVSIQPQIDKIGAECREIALNYIRFYPTKERLVGARGVHRHPAT